MIKFKCPHCEKDVTAGDANAGKKGRCPGCKEIFTIPGGADYDPDDPDAVEELKKRVGVKIVKREDKEAISESPRKRRPSRDEEEEDRRPSRKRGRDEDEEEEETRSRRKRGGDDDEDEDDDRPRKKRKKRRGQYADCPDCGARGDATLVSFTWWGGILGPRLFTHVRCHRCGTCYNGKTGNYNTTAIAIYVAVGTVIALGLVVLGILTNT